MTAARDQRSWILPAVAVVLSAVALSVDPVPQDPAYHLFADRRTILGVPHFWNVVSNVPFVLVGIWGLLVLANRRATVVTELGYLYPALFAALILTGIGSAAYHLSPSNSTLVWDRVGITLAVASLFCIVLGEHVSVRGARRLFLPLAVAGLCTVAWWAFTEARMAGDLRPYALFQFMPMLLVPLILFLYPSRFDRSAFIWWVIALYALAKACEMLDPAILAATGVLSGHSLKHVVAALAMAIFTHGLIRRREATSRPPR